MILLFILSTVAAIAALMLTLITITDVRGNNTKGFIDLRLTNSRPLRDSGNTYCLYRLENNQ
jgi:hypothetical protein